MEESREYDFGDERINRLFDLFLDGNDIRPSELCELLEFCGVFTFSSIGPGCGGVMHLRHPPCGEFERTPDERRNIVEGYFQHNTADGEEGLPPNPSHAQLILYAIGFVDAVFEVLNSSEGSLAEE